MKTLIASFIVLATLAGPPSAETADEVALCATVGELAESVMAARQGGGEMETMMQAAGESDAIRMMIRAAFDVPQQKGERDRAEAVNEFRQTLQSQCNQM